ncbi:MAG TPA: phosphoadenosine phosphosulfate reductase family protein, partial [Novosphingobium sp.]|nr:phosphoadenosine phosphosulfate reductase family protein [Novosphingobium sp.]
AKKNKGESIRVFPISNWTELDIWQYIRLNDIPIVPLYFSAVRPTYEWEGQLFMADDIERLEKVLGYRPEITEKSVRFRTLGCFPLTGAVESEAKTLPEVIQETLLTTTSERHGRVIDKDAGGAGMEVKNQQGNF